MKAGVHHSLGSILVSRQPDGHDVYAARRTLAETDKHSGPRPSFLAKGRPALLVIHQSTRSVRFAVAEIAALQPPGNLGKSRVCASLRVPLTPHGLARDLPNPAPHDATKQRHFRSEVEPDPKCSGNLLFFLLAFKNPYEGCICKERLLSQPTPAGFPPGEYSIEVECHLDPQSF